MATLHLVRFENGDLALQGTGDRSPNANLSLFDVDGEGGDPFAFGNREWEIVAGVESSEYDPADTDSFWSAQQAVIDSARQAGIELPDYV